MEMTNKTKLILIRETELSIEFVTKAMDDVRLIIRKMKSIQMALENHKINSDSEFFHRMNKMLEYRMLVGIIYLDLASVTRAHMNSKYSYEKLFSARQIIVIINEGYKQIYNYLRYNNSGALITRNRNKSFWHKDIKNYIDIYLPELISEHKKISQKLDKFNGEFSLLKDERDLSVHYDKKASKVYDMTVGIDIDAIFLKMGNFLGILTDMVHFTEKIAILESIKTKNNIHEQNLQLEFIFNKLIEELERKRTPANENQIKKLIEMINKSKSNIIEKVKNENT